jgi:hypothetical protein
MALKLDDLLPAIRAADDAGLSSGTIKTRFVGKSSKRDSSRKTELDEKLASLLRAGTIWGPLKHGSARYYFAAGRGPSIETTSRAVVQLVLQARVKLLSKPTLQKKVTGMNGRFFDDGIKHAVASGAIVELACGKSKYYLHRDVAKEHFGFDAPAEDPRPSREPPARIESPLTLADVLPIYRRLKAEQGGFSAVKIFDLVKALDQPKEAVHRLLIAEAKAGRISIHPTTSVELPAELIDAGIRLPGFAEPFVTVVVKSES